MNKPRFPYKSFKDFQRQTNGCQLCHGKGTIDTWYPDEWIEHQKKTCPDCDGTGQDPKLKEKYAALHSAHKNRLYHWRIYRQAVKKLTKEEREVIGL